MQQQEAVQRLAAAVSGLASVGSDVSRMRAAIAQVAAEQFGLIGVAVVAEQPGGVTRPGVVRWPLSPGLWLACDGYDLDQAANVEGFARIAGAMLEQAAQCERAASDCSGVLARLDQVHRDLDNAQRAEWIAGERSRIAQDLHDRVAQTLFGIGLKADWLLTHLERDEHLRTDLERVKQLASTGLKQVREAIFSLSSAPVEAQQFKPAVQSLLKGLEVAGIAGDLRTWGNLQMLPSEVTDALFQVIREALVNVRRHSGASTVLVSVRIRPERVTAVVQDDGSGLPAGVMETFRESGAHLGLRGMESRVSRLGGKLSLSPGDECGLVVTAIVPLKGGVPNE